eukprot:3668064-Prorocentrum_lima.AAC.1
MLWWWGEENTAVAIMPQLLDSFEFIACHPRLCSCTVLLRSMDGLDVQLSSVHLPLRARGEDAWREA